MKLIINDLDLNNWMNGYNVTKLEGLTGLPSIRITTGQNAGRDGGWSTSKKYDARTINIEGQIFVIDGDLAKLEEMRRSLMTLLNQDDLTLTYVTDAGNTYMSKVNVTSVNAPENAGIIRSYQIVLRCDDPILYDSGSTSEIVATLKIIRESGGFEIPFELPLVIGTGVEPTNVVNQGTVAVYPVITIKGTSHTPTITNVTTNQAITLQVDTTADDQIVINCAPTMHTVTKNGTDNIYNTLKEGFEFPVLQPGDNKMRFDTVSENDTAIAEIRYLSGYIGI